MKIVDRVRTYIIRRRMRAIGFMPDLLSFEYHSIIAACIRLNILDACHPMSATASEVADRCGIRAVDVLVTILQIMTYLGLMEESNGRFKVTTGSPLLTDRRLRAWILQRQEEIGWLRSLPDFLITGESQNIHSNMSDAQWEIYQNAFAEHSFAGAMIAADVTSNAAAKLSAVLDIGGASGANVKQILRHFPSCKATIVELPQVVERVTAKPPDGEWADRISYRSGDARDLHLVLGEACYDLVMIVSLLHHLEDEEQIESLLSRAADAVRPGGRLVVGSHFGHRNRPSINDQLAWLPFTLSSGSRIYYFEDFAELVVRKGLSQPRRLKRAPLYVMQK